VSKAAASDGDKILQQAVKTEQAIQNAAQRQERRDESFKFSY
jgi:hypothetical protein